MTERNVRQLSAAVIMQAVRDYLRTSTANKIAILKDLRSDWMCFLSNDMSKVVAEQLEKNPKEIAERLRRGNK